MKQNRSRMLHPLILSFAADKNERARKHRYESHVLRMTRMNNLRWACSYSAKTLFRVFLVLWQLVCA